MFFQLHAPVVFLLLGFRMFVGNNEALNGQGPSAGNTAFISPVYNMNRTLSPYPDSSLSGKYSGKYPPYAKKTMSFLTLSDFISVRAIPVFGAAAYLGSSIPVMAYKETFVQ